METSLCTQIATYLRKAGPSPQPLQTPSSISFYQKSGQILATRRGGEGHPDLSAAVVAA